MDSLTLQTRKYASTPTLLNKYMLTCGILSSPFYVFANIICAIRYEGYNSVSQTVSELSALDAPTRILWVSLMIVYTCLMIAFSLGVIFASSNKFLRIVGILFLIDAIIGLFWPPMHRREVLAAGGGTLTDTMHIIFTFVHMPFVIAAIGFGAAAFGKSFRLYSVITLVILIGAGVLTGIDSPKVQTNLPTPLIGMWERVIIGVYMLWIVVLAILLLRKHQTALPKKYSGISPQHSLAGND